MPYLKNIETAVLLRILAAQALHYERTLTMGEATDCQATIKRLKFEIASRGKSISLLDKPLSDYIDNLKIYAIERPE